MPLIAASSCKPHPKGVAGGQTKHPPKAPPLLAPHRGERGISKSQKEEVIGPGLHSE